MIASERLWVTLRSHSCPCALLGSPRGIAHARTPKPRAARRQGIGLLRGHTWAEWLTALVTSSFIPIECYEIAKGATVWNVALLIVNSAIVVYLVRHLRRRSRAC